MIADANNGKNGNNGSEKSEETDSGNLQPQGVGGHLFGRRENLRGDCQLAKKMIGLGVIEPEQTDAILKSVFALTVEEINAGNARNVAALMRIPVEIAKMQIALDGDKSPSNPRFQQVNIYVPDNGRNGNSPPGGARAVPGS